MDVQCNILSFEDYQKYEHFIESIPALTTKIVQQRTGFSFESP